jgi:2-oxo-4-hydroxy-4-carboxy-5-ureidoimidazoline decarboxylase
MSELMSPPTPLDALNALTPDARAEVLRSFCGASSWVDALNRPHASRASFEAAVAQAFDALDEAGWLAAFAHHPRIGDRARLRERFARSGALSEREQAAVAQADEATIDALFVENQAYEARHGHIFIVCATGRSAAEMLELLRARIGRSREDERIACSDEQRKITAIRVRNHFGAT